MASIDKRLMALESITPMNPDEDWCLIATCRDGKVFMRRLSTNEEHEMSNDELQRIAQANASPGEPGLIILDM